jgi:hypothetical protein
MTHRFKFPALAVIAVGALSGATLHHTIGETTARSLVRQALAAMGARVPESNLKPMTSYWSPEFFNYAASLPQDDDRPVLTFYLAVNPWNSEIWDAKNCKRITSPSIEREQQAIWGRSGLPAEAREALHYKVPGECVGIAK